MCPSSSSGIGSGPATPPAAPHLADDPASSRTSGTPRSTEVPGDVIVARATPWGHGALAIVRLSGPGCHRVVRACARPLHGAEPLGPGRPRRIALHHPHTGALVDDGLAWLARAPATYTGEDTAELTLHGHPRLVEQAVDALCAAGARRAAPGAFTRRAYLHGKLDLVRAEAVVQLAEARTDAGLAVARAGLDGTVSATVAALRDRMVGLLAELEGRLDHAAEVEEDAADDAAAVQALHALAADAQQLADTWPRGRRLVEGATVALVGPPNVGKSSLFNRLVGEDRALVHDAPGTTRDVVEARVALGPVSVVLQDTAGQREGMPDMDPVERAGVARARARAADADLVVVVVPVCAEHGAAAPSPTSGPVPRWADLGPGVEAVLQATAERPRVVVWHGIDRLGARASEDAPPAPPRSVCEALVEGEAEAVVATSAVTGDGMAALQARIRRRLLGRAEAPAGAQVLIASARQRDALAELARAAEDAAEALEVAGLAAAADVAMDGLLALDALTGADPREDVLTALFSRFCIGK